MKGSRYLTHMLKLGNFAGPLSNFFASGILRLGGQMTCVLWQLPHQPLDLPVPIIRCDATDIGSEPFAARLAAIAEEIRAQRNG